MTWFGKLLVHFPLTRHLVTDEEKRDRKVAQSLKRADRVLEDYRRMDVALKLQPRRHR